MGLKREKNPNWKGGRTISSHGYVRIKMLDHPFADVAGYVYEHRLVIEKKLGRYLKDGEIVHHINGKRQDNTPENLRLAADLAEHKSLHRKTIGLRPYGAENPTVECGCGCGETFLKYDSSNRPRKYITGHGKRGKASYVQEEIKCACGCGTILLKYDSSARVRKYISGHNTKLRYKKGKS